MYKPLKSFKDKQERAEYVRATMLAEGLKILEDYKGNNTPMLVEIMDGQYKGYTATATWNNFIKGKRPDFRGLVEKEKFLWDMFIAEGYTVVNIPINVKVTDKIDLISPEGHEWSVSYDTFRTGVRCPLDSNKSWGERYVASILKQNDIPFQAQKAIFHTDGSKQFMDFYVEHHGTKFDIEYNGRQHYQTDPDNSLFLPVEEQKAADEKKKSYCKEEDIIYVELPYTLSKVDEIARELKKYIPIVSLNKQYVVEAFSIDKEMVEYYMNHSERTTAKKFGVCGSTVRKAARKLGYKKHTKHKDGE